MGRYEITAGLVDNHGDVLTREHAACFCGHDGECEVDAETRVLKDPRNLALGEFDVSLVEFLGVGTTAGPELAENPPLVVGLDAELGGECEALVQMAAADVPARACREGRERPELAAVATVPTAVAVGGGIRVRNPVKPRVIGGEAASLVICGTWAVLSSEHDFFWVSEMPPEAHTRWQRLEINQISDIPPTQKLNELQNTNLAARNKYLILFPERLGPTCSSTTTTASLSPSVRSA